MTIPRIIIRLDGRPPPRIRSGDRHLDYGIQRSGLILRLSPEYRWVGWASGEETGLEKTGYLLLTGEAGSSSPTVVRAALPAMMDAMPRGIQNIGTTPPQVT